MHDIDDVAVFRGVTDSINMLLNACMSAAPGQKECDNALRNIQVSANSTRGLLFNITD